MIPKAEGEKFLPETKAPAASNPEDLFSREIGLNVLDCYQCQKCSAGCPVVFAMDLRPNQILQMIALGMKERVLSCKTIWICASCYTCTTRCPNGIDIAGVMDGLRQTAFREGRAAAERDAPLFHSVFLDSVRTHGRVHELGMMARYKMKTGKWFADFKLGWRMFTKGKLKLWPSRIRRRKEVRALFDDPRTETRKGP
jgi:heterodisulfide reductase subunit C2